MISVDHHVVLTCTVSLCSLQVNLSVTKSEDNICITQNNIVINKICAIWVQVYSLLISPPASWLNNWLRVYTKQVHVQIRKVAN